MSAQSSETASLPTPVKTLIDAIRSGERASVYLVSGDRVLAEPAATALATALAETVGCTVDLHRRPAGLRSILDDLRTFSLFDTAKVVLAVDTGVLADRSAAARFIDEAVKALPVDSTGESDLTSAQRNAGARLFQAIRLFDLDPYSQEPARLLSELPDWAFQGAKSPGKGGRSRSRTKKQVAGLRDDLAELLVASRAAEISGFAEQEVSDLAAAAGGELPEGHALVLSESSVDPQHPIVAGLVAQGTIIQLGQLTAQRGGGWSGLQDLATALQRETGVGVTRDGFEELARRTLKKVDRRSDQADASSTGRLAAEYRKLAHVAQGNDRQTIDRDLVARTVDDRGEEDVWQILDAIGAGNANEALARINRLMAAAPDLIAARLSFFALLASFCRHLTAVGGLVKARRLKQNERSYPRFKSSIAPAIQSDFDRSAFGNGDQPAGSGSKGAPKPPANPVGKLHPFRLHKAYLAAARMSDSYLAQLPSRVLETELRLKGNSGEPETALAELVTELARGGRATDSSVARKA